MAGDAGADGSLRGARLKNGQVPPKLQAVRLVGDAEQTARFEWDYKDVIAQLFQECNFAQGSQMMHDGRAENAVRALRWAV